MLEETMVHTQDATTFGYITKFFFGLLFLIVTLTLFLSIACMENRKDSLLYAKFIADVGRWFVYHVKINCHYLHYLYIDKSKATDKVQAFKQNHIFQSLTI